MMHRWRNLLLRPRGPRSGPVIVSRSVITYWPHPPTRRHTAISPHGGLYAMPSLCGSAEATASGSELSLHIPSRHAILSDPGEFRHRNVQYRDADRSSPHLPARHSQDSAIRFHAGLYYVASLVHFCYGLSGCSPPWSDQPELLQPPETFTSRLSTGRSPFPPLDDDTTSTGLPMSAGLITHWKWQLASLH